MQFVGAPKPLGQRHLGLSSLGMHPCPQLAFGVGGIGEAGFAAAAQIDHGPQRDIHFLQVDGHAQPGLEPGDGDGAVLLQNRLAVQVELGGQVGSRQPGDSARRGVGWFGIRCCMLAPLV